MMYTPLAIDNESNDRIDASRDTKLLPPLGTWYFYYTSPNTQSGSSPTVTADCWMIKTTQQHHGYSAPRFDGPK